jgi:aminopeptidase C
MAALKLVVSLPDLKMLVSELIEKEGAILKDGYPKDFNTLEVKSRQRLLRTYLLKTQALINQSQDPKAAALEAVEAFNALKEQLNRHTVVPVNLNDFKNVP